jgi:glycosyltransferase involved in cell wall biosynthesis
MRVGLLDQTTRGWSAGENFTRIMLACIELAKDDRDAEVIFLTRSKENPIPCSFKSIFIGEYPNRTQWTEGIKDAGLDVVIPVRDHTVYEVDLPFVGWIPDFQHLRLPELFDAGDIQSREQLFSAIALKSSVILLSSESARIDFEEFFPDQAAKAHVAHFPSLLWTLDHEDDSSTLRKYHLPQKFALVANQFWRHKNHQILPPALGLLKRRRIEIDLVVTGLPSDYRDPENKSLSQFFQGAANEDVAGSIHFLGQIPYGDLVAIMRAAALIIQPSFFEGWSTSIEDSKALGRPLVCSDVPVHREQVPDALGFFDPTKPEMLADLLADIYGDLRPGPDLQREEAAIALARMRASDYGHRLLQMTSEAMVATRLKERESLLKETTTLPGEVSSLGARLSDLDQQSSEYKQRAEAELTSLREYKQRAEAELASLREYKQRVEPELQFLREYRRQINKVLNPLRKVPGFEWLVQVIISLLRRCFVRSVANSDEAKLKAAEAELSHGELVSIWRAAIASTYAHFLKRQPSEEEFTAPLRGLEGGIPLESFVRSVANSDEAKLKAAEAKARTELSDGEFILSVGQLLYGRGVTPVEVAIWQKSLNGSSAQRNQFVSNMIDEHVRKLLQTEPALHDPGNCWILGTTKLLTRKLWEQRGRQIFDRSGKEKSPPLSDRRFTHSGSFKVSMIASLYKGRDYICNFLDNITSQSAFDNSELIIVDADSPEREWELIEKYQKVYDNIVYKRFGCRISIYQAWNVGVELARGRYLTNTNLDDLRRSDSIELQAALLDQNADVDVVYQDVYYSFDANLSFEAVAAYGFKSEAPIITAHNLLHFNSPHNAPMWRKNLHDELGLFDTRYKSAGDYEFWLRCFVAGKKFRKTNTPHVAYYQNPKGISTKPDTRGVEEAGDLLRRYSRKLTSRILRLSRSDFFAALGLTEEEAARLGDLSYYDVAQRELVRLGARRRQLHLTEA